MAKKLNSKTKKSFSKKGAGKSAIKKKASSKKVNSIKPITKKNVKKAVVTKKKIAKKTVKKKVIKKVTNKKQVTNKATLKNKNVKGSAEKKIVTKKLIVEMSQFLTPLDDRLLVQLSGAEKMTAGGLYIPDNVSDVSGNLKGTIVSAGPGHKDKKGNFRPLDVKLGDVILFSEFSGTKITLLNQDYILIRETEVLGVEEK